MIKFIKIPESKPVILQHIKYSPEKGEKKKAI
jgi:hypothetical protein